MALFLGNKIIVDRRQLRDLSRKFVRDATTIHQFKYIDDNKEYTVKSVVNKCGHFSTLTCLPNREWKPTLSTSVARTFYRDININIDDVEEGRQYPVFTGYKSKHTNIGIFGCRPRRKPLHNLGHDFARKEFAINYFDN